MVPEKRTERNLLLALAETGIAAVQPARCMPSSLDGAFPGRAMHMIAIGKAAHGMASTAIETLGQRVLDGLVIAPEAGPLPERLRLAVGDHPVPGPHSFEAGRVLADYLASLGDSEPLLLLLSGGGSALVELPAPGIGEEDIRLLNEYCLGCGLPIAQVNALRARVSSLKGGGLAALAGKRDMQALAISDVLASGPEFIASGPFSPSVLDAPLPEDLPPEIRGMLERAGHAPRQEAPVSVIADNRSLIEAVKGSAESRHIDVELESELHGDAEAMAGKLAQSLRDMPPGLLVSGGETTVNLPDRPGRGGRNQQLALALARDLAGVENWCALAIGSDGIDGLSMDAGALVDGSTVERASVEGFDVDDALRSADAGPLLEAAGDLVHTGPTGTNVADLFLAWKWEA